MKSWPSRSATIGTNSWPGRSDRESNDGPVELDIRAVQRAARRRRHVGCPDSHGAERYRRDGGESTMASSDRIHLVVLFGGQSAEHDVSCTTAAHVLAAADPARYRVTPIGISTEGEWALAQGALDALEAGPQALPDRLDPSGPSLSPTADARRGHRPVPSAPSSCRCSTDRWARTARCRGCSSWPTSPSSAPACSGRRSRWTRRWPSRCSTANGIPQARYRAFADHERTPGLPVRLADELGLPCFVKPANMGSSVGVTKARDRRAAA